MNIYVCKCETKRYISKLIVYYRFIALIFYVYMVFIGLLFHEYM